MGKWVLLRTEGLLPALPLEQPYLEAVAPLGQFGSQAVAWLGAMLQLENLKVEKDQQSRLAVLWHYRT